MLTINKIFKRKQLTNTSSELETINSFNYYLEELKTKDDYISKKEYLKKLELYQDTFNSLNILQEKNMLEEFAKKNKIKLKYILELINTYNNFSSFIDSLNQNYINQKLVVEKDYLDNILKSVDKNIILDREQREVVLSDEDYTLVIAGAGAGKTTTIAAKVKYLVEKKNIKPNEILIISFTNKAVGELQDKINKKLKIASPITTFHSTGNAILHKQSNEPLNIADDSKMYFVLQEYFKTKVLKDESTVKNLILFFASYFDAPFKGNNLEEFFNATTKQNHYTLKSDLDEYKKEVLNRRTKKTTTILNENLRSVEEVRIANYLYLHNIDYEYEPIYPYNITYANKPYTPDFIIKQGKNICYLEHFGISENGKNPLYSQETLEIYKKRINDKIKLHQKHQTRLIYTFSQYNDGKDLLNHLEEKLLSYGFTLQERSNFEVMQKIISTEENKYIRRLLILVCRFISNFKVNGYNLEDFDKMYYSTSNVRNRLFLNIARSCYLEYQKYLKENNQIDFQDMINESARLLKEVKDLKQQLDFKYIIVDEYQDISKQRFDLVNALSSVCNAKIIAVGDDWQSIYAFSGSDISLFTEFEKKQGYAKLIKIENTYRNAQEVIDIAGNFIQKNDMQIKKSLKSSKHINKPVIIYTYDESNKNNSDKKENKANYNLARTVENILTDIIKLSGSKNSSILMLGRYGFDAYNLARTGLFEFKNYGSKLISAKYPLLNITFMTVHSSKGLGYDNVIILNGKNETYGFPSKIEDDPVLNFVIKQDRSITYAEERRLFYVALTRTKNRIFIAAPSSKPSEFLLEINKDYQNVTLKGFWNEESREDITKKVCPKCGYPLQYKYKISYGLPLFICTNEPEICDFMTNSYEVKEPIRKCPDCQDGFLIVKKTKDGKYILGCTNFKPNKKGCNKVIQISKEGAD
jgi:DNA helicase-4